MSPKEEEAMGDRQLVIVQDQVFDSKQNLAEKVTAKKMFMLRSRNGQF